MDWSKDTPVPSTPLPCVFPVGKHMPSLYVPLPKEDNNMSGPSNPNTPAMLLNYGNNQPTNPILQDGSYSKLLIFDSESTRAIDVHNITMSLSRVAKFMKNNPIKGDTISKEFATISETVWEIIKAVYISKWDLITFRRK